MVPERAEDAGGGPQLARFMLGEAVSPDAEGARTLAAAIPLLELPI